MRTPDIEWTRIQDLVLNAEGHVFDRRTRIQPSQTDRRP